MPIKLRKAVAEKCRKEGRLRDAACKRIVTFKPPAVPAEPKVISVPDGPAESTPLAAGGAPRHPYSRHLKERKEKIAGVQARLKEAKAELDALLVEIRKSFGSPPLAYAPSNGLIRAVVEQLRDCQADPLIANNEAGRRWVREQFVSWEQATSVLGLAALARNPAPGKSAWRRPRTSRASIGPTPRSSWNEGLPVGRPGARGGPARHSTSHRKIGGQW